MRRGESALAPSFLGAALEADHRAESIGKIRDSKSKRWKIAIGISLEFLLFKSGDYARSPAPHFSHLCLLVIFQCRISCCLPHVTLVEGILLHVLSSETVYGVIVVVRYVTF